MPVLTPQAIAALTIAVGILSCIVGAGLLYFLRPCRAAKQGMASLLSHAFTGFPILCLVWNCLALSFQEWGVASTTTLASEEPVVLGVTLGVGAPLLAYAGISVLFHIASDLIEAVKVHFIANPE